jgi:hypothetical protein
MYLKATATHDSSIAEYMLTLDCNLNAGKGGAGVGRFNDNKVCQYNSVVTGPNAGGATWVQANNIVLNAADTGGFKINTEFDISNGGADCAVAVRNCYDLYIGGIIQNPITAYIAISTDATVAPKYGAHFGILINGSNVADPTNGADIENSGGAAVGICQGCLIKQTHSQAAFVDNSTTPVGLAVLSVGY